MDEKLIRLLEERTKLRHSLASLEMANAFGKTPEELIASDVQREVIWQKYYRVNRQYEEAISKLAKEEL